MDSNQRRQKPAGLQPAPIGHSGNPPKNCLHPARRRHRTVKKKRLSGSIRAGEGTRTPNRLLTKQVLYLLSYTSESRWQLGCRRRAEASSSRVSVTVRFRTPSREKTRTSRSRPARGLRRPKTCRPEPHAAWSRLAHATLGEHECTSPERRALVALAPGTVKHNSYRRAGASRGLRIGRRYARFGPGHAPPLMAPAREISEQFSLGRSMCWHPVVPPSNRPERLG